MDKVKFNQNSEILAEDLNAVGVYTENAVQNLIVDFLNDGNIVTGLKIKAQPVPGLSVYAEPGRIYQKGLQGLLSSNSEAIIITAPPASGKRIDRICAKYSEIEDLPETRNFIDVNTKQINNVTTKTRVHGTIIFQVIAGTAGTNPTAPAVPEGWASLAQVTVNAGVNAIQQTDIVDVRPISQRLLNHTHSGLGDGAQIDHKLLLNSGINSHTQIDEHLASASRQAFTNLGDYSGDLNSISRNTVCQADFKNTSNNPPADYGYGTVITYGGPDSWSQMYIPHAGEGQMWFRSGWDSDRKGWKQLVTADQVTRGTAIGQIPDLVDVGGGKAGLPAVSGKLLTDISGVPVGSIIAFPGAKIPPGYLKCNGQLVGRATYPDLFTAIGTIYGAGDGSTTFNLPDLRGEFIRGFDDGRGIDAGRNLGSWQSDDFKAHTHGMWPADTPSNSGGNMAEGTGGRDAHVFTEYTGGSETRPRNLAMIYCIKSFDVPINQAMLDMTKLANDVASKANLTDFSGNKASLGYQKLPGGLILQWGWGSTDANGKIAVTFPIAFPNCCTGIVANHIGGGAAMVIENGNTRSNNGTTLTIFNYLQNVMTGWFCSWFAIGW